MNEDIEVIDSPKLIYNVLPRSDSSNVLSNSNNLSVIDHVLLRSDSSNNVLSNMYCNSKVLSENNRIFMSSPIFKQSLESSKKDLVVNISSDIIENPRLFVPNHIACAF